MDQVIQVIGAMMILVAYAAAQAGRSGRGDPPARVLHREPGLTVAIPPD